MEAMSRRTVLMDILPGAAVAIAGVGTIGWAIAPEVADAIPLGVAMGNHMKMEDLVEKARVVVVGSPRHRRRHRRWVCWWHRGRRVCGWR
jgi:hypothetical protein